jgi:hypothetical protein
MDDTTARRPKCSDIPDSTILEACRAFHEGMTDDTPDESLADRWPVKVILAKMERMEARGLLECGVSIRTARPVKPKAVRPNPSSTRVREEYPGAVAWHNPEIRAYHRWEIRSEPGSILRVGSGTTEEQAWKDAATRLRSRARQS